MPNVHRRRPLDELNRLANQIFEQNIRETLHPEDDGKFIAIDVDSAAFEVDADDYTAVMRLRKRLPAAEIWLMRAGYPAAIRL